MCWHCIGGSESTSPGSRSVDFGTLPLSCGSHSLLLGESSLIPSAEGCLSFALHNSCISEQLQVPVTHSLYSHLEPGVYLGACFPPDIASARRLLKQGVNLSVSQVSLFSPVKKSYHHIFTVYGGIKKNKKQLLTYRSREKYNLLLFNSSSIHCNLGVCSPWVESTAFRLKGEKVGSIFDKPICRI